MTPLTASSMLSEMGWEKFQMTPGTAIAAVHGGDEVVLVLVEDGTPPIFGLEIDEVFGVEEAGGIGAVVGAAGLADDLGDFGKRGHDIARLVGEGDAFGGAAGRQGAADPDGAFVKVGKEFGADEAAEYEEDGEAKRKAAMATVTRLCCDGAADGSAVAPR